MAAEFYIPQLGQTVEEVTIIRWLAQDGARVKMGQEIVEVQTDKTVFPVEANANGYLHIGPYKEGDVVPVLTVVAIIGSSDDVFELAPGTSVSGSTGAPETVATETAPVSLPVGDSGETRGKEGEKKLFASPRARKLAGEKEVDLYAVTPTGWGGVRVREQDVWDYLDRSPRISPVAQRMASELGVDLRHVKGTGPGGRITKDDVLRPESAMGEPLSAVDILERVPLTGIRKVIADRMSMSVHSAAHVTLIAEADATELVALRERVKARVADSWGFVPGYNDFLIKIVSTALREFPYMNARLNADTIEYLSHVHVGLAVDAPQGLLVPVIRDADTKSLRQVGAEIRERIDRARQGRALPDDLTGGTFTITNLGMYRVDAFTPIINLPESAILGVGRIVPRVLALPDRSIAVRDTATLSLSFDHRLTDGAPAARFLQFVVELIEDPMIGLIY